MQIESNIYSVGNNLLMSISSVLLKNEFFFHVENTNHCIYGIKTSMIHMKLEIQHIISEKKELSRSIYFLSSSI